MTINLLNIIIFTNLKNNLKIYINKDNFNLLKINRLESHIKEERIFH